MDISCGAGKTEIVHSNARETIIVYNDYVGSVSSSPLT